MEQPIYLDFNATAPILPEVADTVREASLRYFGNPASQHAAGRETRRALEDAKERVAELLGARLGGPQGDQIVLTSGGTEANNLAIQGVAARFNPPSSPCHCIVTPLEHASVAQQAHVLRDAGWRVDLVGVDPAGRVQLEQFAHLLSDATRLVSIVLAPSETGVLQPVAELVRRLQDGNTVFHTDAVQAVGKIPVDFRQLGVGALSLAAHKFHGPLGIGALLLKSDVAIRPHLVGGSQQNGLRPGTEMAALAIGMCLALELQLADRSRRNAQIASLRDELERRLHEHCPEMVVLGGDALRLPNTSNVSFPGLDRQALVMALDLSGVTCSAGSACASGAVQTSPAHQAMGLSESIQRGAVRFSIGASTTALEIDAAVRRISSVHNRLRDS